MPLPESTTASVFARLALLATVTVLVGCGSRQVQDSLTGSTAQRLVTLEQFHGVSEMYYYFGMDGHEQRSELLQGRVRTDALGLPIITIPISQLP